MSSASSDGLSMGDAVFSQRNEKFNKFKNVMKSKIAIASAQRSNVQMFLGLMLSFAGSSLIEGTVPTLIATGLLATVWIPFYTTLSGVINASGVIISRLLMDRSPYQVLLLCELYDIGLTVLAIIVAACGYVNITGIVMVYLVGSSFLPVLTNIANNTYVGNLSLRSHVAANRFNVVSLFLMTIATLIVARPLGSFFVSHSLYLIFVINLLLTFMSLWCRWQALKIEPLAQMTEEIPQRVLSKAQIEVSDGRLQTIPVGNATGKSEVRGGCITFRQRLNLLGALQPFKGHVFSFRDTSPLVISLAYLSIALFLYYLPLWLAGSFTHKGSIIAIVEASGGAGSTLGPLLFGWLGRRFSLKAQVVVCVMGIALLEGVALLLVILHGAPHSWYGMVLFIPLVFGLFLTASYCNIATLTSRQQHFAGKHYIEMVGLAYTFTSLFTLVGSWLGYWMNAAHQPVMAIMIGMIIAIMTSIGLLLHRSDHTNTDTPGNRRA